MDIQHNQQQPPAQSLYDILRVTREASTQDITKTFRKRAIKEHPDKGGDPEKFRSLSEAYEILKDPVRKDLYDKYGLEGVKAGGNPNGRNLFDIFQSQHSKGPKKSQPKLVMVEIDLERAFVGGIEVVEVKRMRTCEECKGQGGQNPVPCHDCQGAGFKEGLLMVAPGMFAKRPVPCSACEGVGLSFAADDLCKVCTGKRVVESIKEYAVKFEVGVPHEHEIIEKGEADRWPNLEAGDIYFRIMIASHPQLTRKGADIYLNKRITLLQALTGVTFNQTLLAQEEILVSSAPGELITNGERKMVKGKGMPFFKNSSSRGNLVITFQIEMPSSQELERRVLFRLAHLINQPLTYNKTVLGQMKYLEEYLEGTDKTEVPSNNPQEGQCAPQ